jgi:hypothetical protein
MEDYAEFIDLVDDESTEDEVEDRPRPGLGNFIGLLQASNSKYGLRPTNRHNFRGNVWQDTDETGDYDPNADGLQCRKGKHRHAHHEEPPEDPDR